MDEMTDETGPVRMHADELEIDAALAQRLVATHFPRWADLPLAPVLPMGTDNALFRLGDAMVVRLPRRERCGITLVKERAWLPRIAPALPVAVPVPRADAGPGDLFPLPWSVYRWLPGETAIPDRIADGRGFAADLAGFIRALQRIDAADAPAPGEHNFFRGAPPAVFDEDVRYAIAALHGEIDTIRVTALWEDALAAPPWGRPPIWLHGDLDARNLLVHDGRLSAVIDFGSLAVGDPACDVMAVWKVVEPAVREEFLAALEVDDATLRRARGWIAGQACMALSYYTMETNAVLVLEARRWLAAVLDDE